MNFTPVFNDKAFPWRQKKLQGLIAADDAAGLEAFLKKYPKAVEWEEVYGPNHQTYIHKAAQDQKYAAASVLLEHGARIDQQGIGGGTVLEHALRLSYADLPPMNAKDEAFVLKLLAKGADINQPDNRGFPPLKTAAWSGKVDTVKFLLAQGANPDTAEEGGRTLLMDMVSNSGWEMDIKIAQTITPLLLKAGADVHRQTDKGSTALFFAHDIISAKMLLEYGADPDHVDKKGRHIWDLERNANTHVLTFVRKVAEERQTTRAAETMENAVDAACHDGVCTVTMKPLTLKKGG